MASGVTRLAIGMLLWSAVSQAPASPVLSESLRTHLRDAPFGMVTSIRGLPVGIRDQLQTMFGGTLDIAEPGAGFGRPKLPTRRLVAAGCSRDSYCLIYYERADTEHTWRAVLFHWTPAATRFEWGGTAPGRFATIDAVRKAVLSGVIKGGQTTGW